MQIYAQLFLQGLWPGPCLSHLFAWTVTSGSQDATNCPVTYRGCCKIVYRHDTLPYGERGVLRSCRPLAQGSEPSAKCLQTRDLSVPDLHPKLPLPCFAAQADVGFVLCENASD